MEWKPCGVHRSRVYRANHGRMVRAGDRLGVLRWAGGSGTEEAMVAIEFVGAAHASRADGQVDHIPPGAGADEVCMTLLRGDFPELFPGWPCIDGFADEG